MPSRVETFNNLVRALVTLGLTAGFMWLAVTKAIDSGVYANTFGIVVTFWFVSRQNQQRAEDIAKIAKANGSTPAPTDPAATTTTTS